MNNPYSSNSNEAFDSEPDSAAAGDTIMQRSTLVDDPRAQPAGTISVLGALAGFQR